MHSIRRALTPLPPRVLPCRSFSSKTNTHPSHPSHTHRFLILGSPGSGKGTQTSRLTKHFPNLVTLSSGDLLRWHITNKTPLGSQISGFIKQGNYVPDSIVSELILQEVQTRYEGRHWLLDGFPRTVCQAKELDKVLAEKGVALSMVVNLDVPERVILDRIENRWIHAPSGRVYNYAFNPPKVRGKDDVTGEDLVKRDDDNPVGLYL